MSRFTEHYQLLGIRPGESWSRVRAAYKSQMRHWHPDRYVQDDDASQHAEEMTKRVNQAYQEIQSYYEKHGYLPLNEPVIAPVRHTGTATNTKTPKPYENTRQEHPVPPANTNPQASSSSRFLAIVILAALASLLWFTDPSTETSHDNVKSIKDHNSLVERNTQDSPSAMPVLESTAVNSGRMFGIGSTLGEVYAVQGVPSKTDGNVWYYGSAEVVFLNGRVTHWNDSDPPVLRTASSKQPAPTTPPLAVDVPGFTHGSTQDEVRAIQGNPIRETANVWDYGQSQVRFDRHGRVVGWTESPYNPLHIKR